MNDELREVARQLLFHPRQGWPQTFTARQISWVQSLPAEVDNADWHASEMQLVRLIYADLKAGRLLAQTINGERHIYPEDFAEWLAANEIEPSRHVAAWFDAVGAGALRIVEDAIDTGSELHRAWIAEAKRGRVRAALLLGVVLWAIGEDEPNPHTDRAIVEGWAKKLMAATVEKWRSGRAVCPLNPVTLIEIEGQPKGLKWVMTLEDADAFLEAHALAFKCSDVLAHWRGEPSPYSDEPPAAIVEPVEGKEARQDRRLQACIDAGLTMNERAMLRLPDGVGELAKSEGVTRQAFTEDVKAALRRKLDSERPKPRLVKPK